MIEQRFSNSLASVKQARQFAARTLVGFSEALVEAVTLMVSELATNSVRHAQSGFTIGLEAHQHCVRVAVTDAGRGTPTIKDPSPVEASGRGLRIIELLSQEWGVLPASTQRGSTVWFRVCEPLGA